MNIKVSDDKKRHPNCVPCVIINQKTGTVYFKGSIMEAAAKLKITTQTMYYYRKLNKPFKDKYIIKRCNHESSFSLS